MIIRGNIVHDNGHIGIICSAHCRNITIEHNEVYNNAGSAILLSIDMKNSVVRNNYIHDSEIGIGIASSDNNQVYENKVSFSNDGIKVMENSSNNYVYNNIFEGIKNYAILARGGDTRNNTFENNDMDNSEKAVRLKITQNPCLSTMIIDERILVEVNSTLNLERTVFPVEARIESDNSTNNMVKISDSGVIIVKDESGNFSNINTKLPLISRINNETLSIISHNGTHRITG